MTQVGKNYCFTLNNYTDENYQGIVELDYAYVIIGKEISSTGTPHLQGYIVFKTSKREKAVRKLIPGAHVEIAKGNSTVNRTYCSKGNDFTEFGTFPLTKKEVGKKEKVRWDEVWDAAKVGNLDAIPPDIRIRSYNQIKRIGKDYMRPRDIASKCFVYWGETGAGKSHRAHAEAGEDPYMKIASNKWWCGYNGQKNVIIEDFDGKIGIGHLKVWFDKYKHLVEIKQGASTCEVEKYWVTSNLHPSEWYPDEKPVHVRALLRRLDIYECTKKQFIDNVTGEVSYEYKINKE